MFIICTVFFFFLYFTVHLYEVANAMLRLFSVSLSVSSKGFPIVPSITYAVARGIFFNDK